MGLQNINIRQARYKLAMLIGDNIMYHYGEKQWYSMPLRKRKFIIEDLFNDNHLQEKFRLSDEEAKKVIKSVQDIEG